MFQFFSLNSCGSTIVFSHMWKFTACLKVLLHFLHLLRAVRELWWKVSAVDLCCFACLTDRSIRDIRSPSGKWGLSDMELLVFSFLFWGLLGLGKSAGHTFNKYLSAYSMPGTILRHTKRTNQRNILPTWNLQSTGHSISITIIASTRELKWGTGGAIGSGFRGRDPALMNSFIACVRPNRYPE